MPNHHLSTLLSIILTEPGDRLQGLGKSPALKGS